MDTTRPSLLHRLRNRSDTDAWRMFDTIYRPMLRRFARRWGLGEQDAEDVVQHCMVAILDHVPDFQYDPARGRFKSWLRTLVNNRIRDLLRDRHEWPAELPRQEKTPLTKYGRATASSWWPIRKKRAA